MWPCDLLPPFEGEEGGMPGQRHEWGVGSLCLSSLSSGGLHWCPARLWQVPALCSYSATPGSPLEWAPGCLAVIQAMFLPWNCELLEAESLKTSSLVWRIHGQRSLAGCTPRGHTELDTE